MTLNKEAIDVLVHYYYPRAKWLQDNVNWGTLDYKGKEANEVVNDELMQNVEIYDCYQRAAAGFSNVLQDLRYGEFTPKWRWQDKERRDITKINNSINWDFKTWLYVFMCHRITGSGASFVEDHGYRNNIMQHWGKHDTIDNMIADLHYNRNMKNSIFTSIGNQPPAPKKGVSNIDFMINELPNLLDDVVDFLYARKRNHKEVVDFLNDYNIKNGHRRFNFAYTAFSLDLSDYFPEIVDEDSHTYLGNNAIRCMKRLGGSNSDTFMDMLRDKTGGKPKDLEDVMCDFVRFGQNYTAGYGVYTNNSGWDSGWSQRNQ